MLKKFQIFGERNSGTNYLKNVMEANFNLQHTSDYGFKHWYIKDHYPRGPPNQTTDNECLKSLDHPEADSVLFIFIVREPIGWLASMNRDPWNAPDHYKLSFSEFIRKPWRSYELTNCHGNSHIHWHPQNGCYFIESAPNICVLRNIKNAHFIGLKECVKNFWIIRQDCLAQDLFNMSVHFNLTCKRENITLLDYRAPKTAQSVSDDDLQFIKSQLNLELESELGFII